MRLVHVLSLCCLYTVTGATWGCAQTVPTAQAGRGLATRLLDPAHGTVFPERLVAGLLQQCSRAAPDDVVGYWTPTAAEVAALEEGLPRVLPATDYYRQYGGIVHRGGRRTIYVNGFSRFLIDARTQFLASNQGHPERFFKFPPGSRDANWWHVVPGVVCDGGEEYFGVEFDPATRRFESLHFNGHA